MTREFVPRKIHLFGTAVQDKKFQPAIGRPATDSEMRQIAKEKGWTEIGNERQDKYIRQPETELPDLSEDDIKSLSDKL